MAALDAVHERLHFAQRLRESLDRAGQAPDSPTALARFFNARYEGPPITVHAARKWLVGEAIPTQEKLRVLANWLQVPLDWLRFGGDNTRPAEEPRGGYSELSHKDRAILDNIRRLDDTHQDIVLTLIQSLIRASKPAPQLQTH